MGKKPKYSTVPKKDALKAEASKANPMISNAVAGKVDKKKADAAAAVAAAQEREAVHQDEIFYKNRATSKIPSLKNM